MVVERVVVYEFSCLGLKKVPHIDGTMVGCDIWKIVWNMGCNVLESYASKDSSMSEANVSWHGKFVEAYVSHFANQVHSQPQTAILDCDA